MWTIGADIGHPTAIVAAEPTEECIDVRHLERLPLRMGTP
jgi:hypothetical protein